jgi:hypothetical protein
MDARAPRSPVRGRGVRGSSRGWWWALQRQLLVRRHVGRLRDLIKYLNVGHGGPRHGERGPVLLAPRRPLGGIVVRRARGREKLYLVYVAAQEVARRELRGSGTKQGAASDPTTRTPDCTKATSSSALASLRDFSNAARRRRRRAPMRPVEVICPASCG